MGKLEDYINSHRSEFDACEPPAGHADRFRARLSSYRPKPRISIPMVAAAATIAGFLFTAGLSLVINHSEIMQFVGGKSLAQTEIQPETVRIMQYYNRLLMQKKQHVYQILPENDISLRLEADRVFWEMDWANQSLMSDLQQMTDNERAVYILTQFYQTQIGIVDMLTTRISEAKNSTKAFK